MIICLVCLVGFLSDFLNGNNSRTSISNRLKAKIGNELAKKYGMHISMLGEEGGKDGISVLIISFDYLRLIPMNRDEARKLILEFSGL
jgi:hypothetical protein